MPTEFASPPRVTRRRLLRASLALSGAAALSAALSAGVWRPGAALAAACLRTPAQTEGPFYPPSFGRPGNDLIAAGADGALPQGELIAIAGRVTDAQCRPLAGAVVEIWQADAHGHYAHPSDSEPAQRDPRFRYWGQALTAADGGYRFRTIQPSPYSLGLFGRRTAHVHFKVRPPQGRPLTTQMYFDGHALNARDGILRSLSERERAAAIARLEPAASGALPTWRFDIALA